MKKNPENYLYIDLETNGLPKDGHYPPIIQIAILDYEGHIIYSQYYKQRKPPEYIVLELLQLKPEFLKSEFLPYFDFNAAQIIYNILSWENVCSYNKEFDCETLLYNFRSVGFNPSPNWFWECAMIPYSNIRNEKRYNGEVKYQKLPRPLDSKEPHDAIGDTRLLIELVKTFETIT